MGALILASVILVMPAKTYAGVFISVGIAPPILPVYEPPITPGDGYIWTPGYWAWGDEGYYWVPGTWVLAPYTGALWTPGYWGWRDGFYVWNGGYWGLHVGFYGGVNYGFGYYGHGFYGGEWRGGGFFYNTAVYHVGAGFHNVYENRTVINNVTINNRVSYNGGTGGIHAEATSQERIAEHEQHMAAMPVQVQHEQAASHSRAQLASVNHGSPAVTATPRPGAAEFHQAMTHPANPDAVQAAHSTPRAPVDTNGQARAAASPAPRAQPQEQRAAPQQQSRPQPQAAPRQQAAPRPAPQPRGNSGGHEEKPR